MAAIEIRLLFMLQVLLDYVVVTHAFYRAEDMVLVRPGFLFLRDDLLALGADAALRVLELFDLVSVVAHSNTAFTM